MNAKQYREKASKFLKNRDETQYKRIKGIIDRFASTGNMEVFFYDEIHSEVLTRLREEGFKIGTPLNERDEEVTYTIKW